MGPTATPRPGRCASQASRQLLYGHGPLNDTTKAIERETLVPLPLSRFRIHQPAMHMHHSAAKFIKVNSSPVRRE